AEEPNPPAHPQPKTLKADEKARRSDHLEPANLMALLIQNQPGPVPGGELDPSEPGPPRRVHRLEEHLEVGVAPPGEPDRLPLLAQGEQPLEQRRSRARSRAPRSGGNECRE